MDEQLLEQKIRIGTLHQILESSIALRKPPVFPFEALLKTPANLLLDFLRQGRKLFTLYEIPIGEEIERIVRDEHLAPLAQDNVMAKRRRVFLCEENMSFYQARERNNWETFMIGFSAETYTKEQIGGMLTEDQKTVGSLIEAKEQSTILGDIYEGEI